MSTSLIWNLIIGLIAAIIAVSMQAAPTRGDDAAVVQPVGHFHLGRGCDCAFPRGCGCAIPRGCGRGFASGGAGFGGYAGPADGGAYYLWHGTGASVPVGGAPSANPYWPPLPGAPAVPLPQLRPILPPPGTLGVTYKKPSRLIPEDRHPRVGMLEVLAPGGADVMVEGLEGFLGEDGLWHFESGPLLPGIPHVYDVKALIERDGKRIEDVRTVRLVPGRIVGLTF